METAERVRLLVAPLVEETDAELYDVEFSGGVLRVTVDRDGGVDMGVIGSLTRAISRLIDETDPIPGTFTLEVSSPGLERALRTPEHFGRAVGESVTVKTHPGVDGDRRCAGTLVAADEDTITVEPDDDTAGDRRVLRIDDIERARTKFAWGPSKSSKQSKQSKSGAKSPKAGAKASGPGGEPRSASPPASDQSPSPKTSDPEASDPETSDPEASDPEASTSKSAPTSKAARP